MDSNDKRDPITAVTLAFEELARHPMTLDGVTLAYLRWRLDEEKQASSLLFAWNPLVFTTNSSMPDSLRAEIVAKLRHHADKLESKELDRDTLKAFELMRAEVKNEDSGPN